MEVSEIRVGKIYRGSGYDRCVRLIGRKPYSKIIICVYDVAFHDGSIHTLGDNIKTFARWAKEEVKE